MKNTGHNKLSVIIPVYNERDTIQEILDRVLGIDLEKEVIVVDDGSVDGTGDILSRLAISLDHTVKVIQHTHNQGKGAAIRTGLAHVTGDVIIIQDADLEYDPAQYPQLIRPIRERRAQVVYGSRNLSRNPRSSWTFYWGGRLLSWITNLLYGSDITDEATGYKVFRTEVLKSLSLESTGFEFCPEVTAKVLRKGIRIYEVTISYTPRSHREGKKIRWKDGLIAIWTLVKYRFWK